RRARVRRLPSGRRRLAGRPARLPALRVSRRRRARRRALARAAGRGVEPRRRRTGARRRRRAEALRGAVRGRARPGGAGDRLAAVGGLVAAVATRRADARHLVAALGLAYGVTHYVGQAKGSEYHLYPLATFVCVLAFSALTPALAAQRARLGVPLAMTLAAALVLLTAKGLEASDAPWIWDRERRVRVLVDDLGRSLAPGDTVQVLDVADGGLHALLRLRVRQPTRFLYDVFFFH